MIVLLVASVLGAEGNGILAVSILLPTVLARLLTLGAPVSNAYFISKGEIGFVDLFKFNIIVWTGSSITGLLASFFIIRAWGGSIFPGIERDYLYVCSLFFPVAFLHTIFCSLWRGLQDFKTYNLAMFMVTGTRLLATVVGVLIEVPVMLLVVKFVNRSKGWYEAGLSEP